MKTDNTKTSPSSSIGVGEYEFLILDAAKRWLVSLDMQYPYRATMTQLCKGVAAFWREGSVQPTIANPPTSGRLRDYMRALSKVLPGMYFDRANISRAAIMFEAPIVEVYSKDRKKIEELRQELVMDIIFKQMKQGSGGKFTLSSFLALVQSSWTDINLAPPTTEEEVLKILQSVMKTAPHRELARFMVIDTEDKKMPEEQITTPDFVKRVKSETIRWLLSLPTVVFPYSVSYEDLAAGVRSNWVATPEAIINESTVREAFIAMFDTEHDIGVFSKYVTIGQSFLGDVAKRKELPRLQKFKVQTMGGQTTTAKVRRLRSGIVEVETWENSVLVTYMTMQNGQVDVSMIRQSVDSPNSAHTFWYNTQKTDAIRHSEGAGSGSRVRIERLVNPIEATSEELWMLTMEAIIEELGGSTQFTDTSEKKLMEALSNALRYEIAK